MYMKMCTYNVFKDFLNLKTDNIDRCMPHVQSI